MIGNSSESAWLNSLADLVEVVASGEYEGGIYVSESNNPDGVYPLIGKNTTISGNTPSIPGKLDDDENPNNTSK